MTTAERTAYMLACASLRRVVPRAAVPDFGRSARLPGGTWRLADGGGNVLALVNDAGRVFVVGSCAGVEVTEATGMVVVEARLHVETRWQCVCGTSWAKPGRHGNSYRTCRQCGAGIWLRLADP